MDTMVKDAMSFAEFLKQPQAVERCIGQLCSRSYPQHMFDDAQYWDRAAFTNLLNSIRLALEIYFYRRVYNVNRSLLQ